MARTREYFATDGDLVLRLKPLSGGWFHVQALFDPEVITQARSLQEAFVMAYDASKVMRESRRRQIKEQNAKVRKHVARRR